MYNSLIRWKHFPSIAIFRRKHEELPCIFLLISNIYYNSMENNPQYKPDPKLKLMDQVRQVLRYNHYSRRTEKTYCDWIVRYVKFHGAKKHPYNMGKTEIEAFLTHLAVNRNVAASTQSQAFNPNFA